MPHGHQQNDDTLARKLPTLARPGRLASISQLTAVGPAGRYTMTTIDTATLRDWQGRGQNFILVDTLPAEIFAKGHLPNAVNIVSDTILDEAPYRLPDKEAAIVVYCGSEACKRARRAAERLVSLGYTEVYHYVGGKRAWLAEDLPLERL